jgi:hypothetical protein
VPAAECPCRGCRTERYSKNNRTCRECERRVAYVTAIGEMTHSVPVEMSDLAAAKSWRPKETSTYRPLHAPVLDE